NTPATQSAASLIPILTDISGDPLPSRKEHITEPSIEKRQPACASHERLDNDAVEDVVEESPFKRDEKQEASRAIRGPLLEIAHRGGRPAVNRVFYPVQIVEHVRRAEELQQSKAGVSHEVDERQRVPPHRDFDHNEADLGQGGIRER